MSTVKCTSNMTYGKIFDKNYKIATVIFILNKMSRSEALGGAPLWQI